MNRLQEATIERLAEQHGRVAVRDGYTDREIRVTAPSGEHWLVSEDGIARNDKPNFSIDWHALSAEEREALDTRSYSIAALRIARAHNEAGPALAGGFLAFTEEGKGGAWYSNASRVNAPIIFPVRHGSVSAADVQEWLNERQER